MINYYLLTKPGIIMGNLFTVAAGFLLASKGEMNFPLFLATLLGLAGIVASACVFNNYIDRQVDKKMERTKDRPLAQGRISKRDALLFATLLGMLGFWLLFVYTNLLTLALAATGFFIYVVLYSFWKGHTIYGTAIGSLAGAMPPVIGYCAVSQHLDRGAFVLFFMLVLWQMPHFFSIALLHFNDYVKARIPVLPVEKGVWRTKIHMVLYIAAFILTAMMLTFFNYTGYFYLWIVLGISSSWLILGVKGFKSENDQLWGQQMFRLSLLVIAAVCLVIPFDLQP